MSAGEEVRSCSNDELEREMCTLQARLAAATCRFLLAVAEYDRRRAWEAWECHDMAGWLAWKCGISPVTAREQVRVARALEELPVLCAELGRGRLSYSQARAISRVATAETEQSLVNLAQACTAAQLERITRAYRRSAEVTDTQERRRDVGRYLRLGWDDDGNLVGHFRLPAEAGAVLVKAVDALRDRSAVEEATSDGAADPVAAVRADCLVEALSAGASAIGEADGGGRDGDGDSRYLLTVIVDEASLQAPGDNGAGDSGAGDSGAGGDEDPGGTCQVEDGPGIARETARRVACDATIVRICESPDGKVLDVGRRTRRVNRAMRRALRRRDGHCQFPGCERSRTQAHHVVHWADGGETRLDNLVSLCSRHHHRLHEGGFRIETDRERGRFVFVHRYGYVLSDAKPQLAVDARAEDDLYGDLQPFRSGWDGTRLDLPTITEGLLLLDAAVLDAVAGGERDSAESGRGRPDDLAA